MDKRIKEPLVMVFMIYCQEPTNGKLSNENSYEKQVIPIEILVQMRVVPIMKSRQLLKQKRVDEIDGEVPFEQNVKQIDDHQIDHEQVN